MRTPGEVRTIVTSRDLTVFRALVIARALAADEISVVGGFQSLRRTNRRLLKLVRAGLLRRWFMGSTLGGLRALYGLSPQSAALIGEGSRVLIHWKRDAILTGSLFLAHQTAVNEIFIQARFRPLPEGYACDRWASFQEPLAPSIPLMPDGYFEIRQASAVYSMFLEADLGTESSKAWRRKVELYLKLALSGEFERMFHQRNIQVLVVFPSPRRMETIRKTIAKRTEKLFWLSTQDDVRCQGLMAPIWFRPTGGERVSLI